MTDNYPFIETIFSRAGEQCQCRSRICGHAQRCSKALTSSDLGSAAHLFPVAEPRSDPHPADWLLLCDRCFNTWVLQADVLPQSAPDNSYAEPRGEPSSDAAPDQVPRHGQ